MFINIQKMKDYQINIENQIKKNVGLKEKDLRQEKTLDLLTEIGKLANDWQGYKYWKENREPIELDKKRGRFPLYEKYISVLGSFLSLSIEMGLHDDKMKFNPDSFSEARKHWGKHGGTVQVFLEMQYWINRIIIEPDEKNFVEILNYSKYEYGFKSAWFLFLCLGIIEFEFDMHDLEEAYYIFNPNIKG